MSAGRGRCWSGGRLLDWNTVALLVEKQLAKRTLAVLRWSDGRLLDWDTVAVLDGRKIAGLEHGGVAGRETAG